jgi:hypothetical protein
MNLNSNVTITPDNRQTLAVMENVNREKQQIQRIELAERQRQKAVFEDYVKKSYKTVAKDFQPGYLDLQDKFIGEVSEVWKDSEGFLSIRDTMKIEAAKKPMDDYVLYANENEKLYTGTLMTLQSDDSDKYDAEASGENIKRATEIKDVYKQNQALNGRGTDGPMLVLNPEKVDFTKKAKAWGAVSTTWDYETVRGTDPVTGQPIYDVKSFNEETFKNNALSYWEQNKKNIIKLNPDHSNFSQFKEDMRGLVDVKSKPTSSKTGSGGGGKAPTVIKSVVAEDGTRRWNMGNDKTTVSIEGSYYDDKGKEKKLKANSPATFVGVVEKDFGSGKKKYAEYKVAKKKGMFDFEFDSEASPKTEMTIYKEYDPNRNEMKDGLILEELDDETPGENKPQFKNKRMFD